MRDQQDDAIEVEINVRLDVRGRVCSADEIRGHESKVIVILRRHGSEEAYRLDYRVTTPDGTFLVPHIVAVVRTDTWQTACAIGMEISEHLQQDCVAIYDHRRDLGELIGPRAKQWGVFDSSIFHRFLPRSQRG